MTKLFLTVFFVLMVAFPVACSKMTHLGGGSELDDINKGKEVININGTVIREGYLDMLGGLNPRINAQLQNPATKKQFLDNLVQQELMYQESLRRGLDRKADVAQKVALYRKIIIAQALLDEELERKAKEYYEKNKDTEFTKVKISHIQVDFADSAKKDSTEPTSEQKQKALEKIKGIQERLKSGEEFAKLAEELSDDKLTKKKGGDLGEVSRDDKRLARRNLEILGETAFNLKTGEVSEPLEAKKGYHLVKVNSEPEVAPYEEAIKMIRFHLQRDIKEELNTQLTQNAKIVFAEEAQKQPAEVNEEQTLKPTEKEGSAKDSHNHPAHPEESASDKEKGETPKEEIKFRPVLKTEEKP